MIVTASGRTSCGNHHHAALPQPSAEGLTMDGLAKDLRPARADCAADPPDGRRLDVGAGGGSRWSRHCAPNATGVAADAAGHGPVRIVVHALSRGRLCW
ncbi:hypothetical protein ABIC16_003965 [Sphingomonas sp. PvP055]|uniref:hypothetical protein n=1 Tax=Sphingomonas sp. PvP055 TaxID=3156391 RepID=UPI00339B3FDD